MYKVLQRERGCLVGGGKLHQLLCSARLFKPIPLPIPANEEKRAKKENKKGDNCNNCSAGAYSCQCHSLLVQILVLAIGDLLLGFSPLLHFSFVFPPLLNLLHLLFGFSSLLHFLLGFSRPFLPMPLTSSSS